MKKITILAFITGITFAANFGNAQDSALLDLLVKKKVITEQEAESTRADLAKEYASTSAGKISISTPVQQIRLYGDARVRYEWREANAYGLNAAGASDTANADRLRYRLRIGADVKLTNDWFLGVRVETSNNGRSTNVTESNSGTNTAPFGKGGTATSTVVTGVTTTVTKNAAGTVTGVTTKTTTGTAVSKVDFGSTIFVGQLYLKYTPYSWLTLEAGKMPNPFVTSAMVWDPDINPEGFAEQFKYTIGPIGGTTSPVASYAKDDKGDKEVATASGAAGGLTIDLFSNLAQLVYDTASPQNQFGTTALGRNDSWLFGWQIGAKVNLKNTYLQVAPTFYNYSGDKNNDFSAIYSGDAGGNQTGINDLMIVEVPAEFGWKSFGIPFSIFGDVAYNLEDGARSNSAGHNGHNDGLAWQAGLSINKIKKQGDWSLAGYWQYSGAYSLDPNLIDDDVFDAHLNMEGVVFKAAYAITDAVSVSLQYNYGQIIDKALGTGGAGGTLNGSSSSPALRNYNLIQADLNVKF